MNTLSPWERAAVRAAVKEASTRAKGIRQRWSLDEAEIEQFAPDPKDLDHARMKKADADDIFVEILQAALRRAGAWILFLE